MKANRITSLVMLTAVFLLATVAAAQLTKPAPNKMGKGSVPTPAVTTTSSPQQITLNSFPPVACSQGHPGENERTKEVFTKGDSHMSKAVSAHVVKYAVQRFKLESVTTPADIVRAENEVYSFLKWKLGNPTAIAGQFATAGYQHFDRAFAWEAAAALVGASLPQETKPEFALPPDDVAKLQEAAKKAGQRLETYLERKYQIPPEYSSQVVDKLVKAAQASTSHLGFNMPKSWEIDENVALVAIAEKISGGTRTPSVVSAAKAVTR